jgi:hypothetical protein
VQVLPAAYVGLVPEGAVDQDVHGVFFLVPGWWFVFTGVLYLIIAMGETGGWSGMIRVMRDA